MSEEEIEQMMRELHHRKQLKAWIERCRRHNKRVDEYNRRLREEAVKELEREQ
jgi:hypothetical protein